MSVIKYSLLSQYGNSLLKYPSACDVCKATTATHSFFPNVSMLTRCIDISSAPNIFEGQLPPETSYRKLCKANISLSSSPRSLPRYCNAISACYRLPSLDDCSLYKTCVSSLPARPVPTSYLCRHWCLLIPFSLQHACHVDRVLKRRLLLIVCLFRDFAIVWSSDARSLRIFLSMFLSKSQCGV